MFYLAMTPILITSLVLIIQLRKMKKHDNVLFMFCQIRRDTMKLLRDDSENLAKDDYVALRPFIKLLDMTIHDYKELKVSLFNFRRFLEYLRNFKITNHSFEQIKWDDNPKLSGLRKDYGYALVSAFFSYTPLIRSEIILKFVLFTLKMFGKETYSTMLETIDAMTKEFDFPLSVMARIRS